MFVFFVMHCGNNSHISSSSNIGSSRLVADERAKEINSGICRLTRNAERCDNLELDGMDVGRLMVVDGATVSNLNSNELH